MTNYEMIKKFSIENMALSIMCPDEMGLLEDKDERCERFNHSCGMCCYAWLQEDSEGE